MCNTRPFGHTVRSRCSTRCCVVFLVEIFGSAVNFGWKWPALAPPSLPSPPNPPLFVFHCRGYQLLAANKDDKDEEDVRGEETLLMMANHIKPLLAVKWVCWGLPRLGVPLLLTSFCNEGSFCTTMSPISWGKMTFAFLACNIYL